MEEKEAGGKTDEEETEQEDSESGNKKKESKKNKKKTEAKTKREEDCFGRLEGADATLMVSKEGYTCDALSVPGENGGTFCYYCSDRIDTDGKVADDSVHKHEHFTCGHVCQNSWHTYGWCKKRTMKQVVASNGLFKPFERTRIDVRAHSSH